MSFVEEASAAIRRAGGRVTPQRRRIIELLEEAEAHLDAEGLYQRVYERDASVSLATVYRTLNVLAEAQLIDQRYISHDHKRKTYEPLGTEEHYHFTCRKCRRVVEFQSALGEAIKRELESRFDVQVYHACMCFEGLCQTCAAEALKAKT